MHISPRLLVSLPNATAGIFIGEIVIEIIFSFFQTEVGILAAIWELF
jgi:hypothetical protein